MINACARSRLAARPRSTSSLSRRSRPTRVISHLSRGPSSIPTRMLGEVQSALLWLGLACAACRYNFEDRRPSDAPAADGVANDAAASDAAPRDAFDTCDPTAPFGTPEPIAELNDPAEKDGT